MNAILSLVHAEWLLLSRNTTAWATAIALPLVIGASWAASGLPIGEGFGAVVAGQIVLILAFTVHTVGTMTLASRRQTMVLKRWRVTQASALSILIGTLGLLVVLGLAQGVVLAAFTAWLSNEMPANFPVLIAGLLSGVAVVSALTFVVAARTRSSEHAMITTGPLLIALMIGGIAVLARAAADVPLWLILAVPGAAAVQLVRVGWEGVAAADALWLLGPSLLATAVHIAVSTWLAIRMFRWQPRA